MTMKSLPTLLTYARLAAAPVTAFLILFADRAILASGAGDGAALYLAALVVFALAALTDAADGMLARKLNAVSPLGAALDHAADKALTSCVLIALAATSLPLDLIVAAILLIGRDVLIGGLREGLALAGRSLPVSQMGKTKTALILVGVAAALIQQTLILGTAMGPATIGAIANFTRLALWAGVALSLWSGIAYLLAASRSDN
jgi:CDP-diacylglycerol--glycerol-3-phosphate 3-phosphatidyltransferase